MYLEVAGLEGVGRICFVEDMNHWEVLIFMVMNICCLTKWFLASQEGLCSTEYVSLIIIIIIIIIICFLYKICVVFLCE